MQNKDNIPDLDLRSAIYDFIYSYREEDDPKAEDVFRAVATHLLSNAYFGYEAYDKDGTTYIRGKYAKDILRRVSLFLTVYGKKETEKIQLLLNRFSVIAPNTYSSLVEFFKERELQDSLTYRILDFLYEKVTKDITELTNEDIEELVRVLYNEQPKYIGDEITFYFSWVRQQKTTYTVMQKGMYTTVSRPKYKVKYTQDFVMKQRVDTRSRTTAYSELEYLDLVYHLLNEEYAKDHDMYKKAAASKEYADTWLYLSLHFICALRDTDLELIYHPKLNHPAKDVLKMVKTNTYTSDMAKSVSMELMHWMYYLGRPPHKTQNYSDVPNVKFFIPASLEEHFGILFSLAEAHHQIAGLTDNDPLIHRITTHREIEHAMGPEIGEMFLESDFSARKANKSYLQSIEMYADPVLANEGIAGTKAYMIASLARSHKGGYGEFAKTTAEYLKDANFNGLSVDFVAKELFERGILSSIVSMLLNIITGGEYDTYSVTQQTKLIQAVQMRPSEVESLIKVSEEAIQRSRKVVNEVLAIDKARQEDIILAILHKLAVGEAPSKEEGIMCIMTAIAEKCPFNNRDCYGCEYDIATKAAGYHLISEYRRINKLYHTVQDAREKEQLYFLMTERLLPFLHQLITSMRQQYGAEYAAEFGKIITENKD